MELYQVASFSPLSERTCTSISSQHSPTCENNRKSLAFSRGSRNVFGSCRKSSFVFPTPSICLRHPSFSEPDIIVVVKVLLYVHRNRRPVRDGSPGRPSRLSHSSWTLKLLLLVAFIQRYSPLSSRLTALLLHVSNDDVWLNVLTCLTRFLWRIFNNHRSGALKHCLVFTWHKLLPIALMTVFFVWFGEDWKFRDWSQQSDFGEHWHVMIGLKTVPAVWFWGALTV